MDTTTPPADARGSMERFKQGSRPAKRQRAYTIPDLCAAAERQGYRGVKPRLVVDWIEKGLLDRATPVYGRGKRGYFPEQQLQLFLSLMEHRRKAPTAKKIWGLLSIPVWVWLRWGDEYVPLRQVRRALRTWVDVMKRGDTRRNALRAARAIADRLGRAASPKGGRPLLSVRKLADIIYQGRLNEESLKDALRTLAQKKPRGDLTTPAHESAVSPEQIIELIAARYDAILHLGEIEDGAFETARKFYLATYPLYLRSGHETATSSEAAERRAEESLNQACLDLITVLGLIRRGVLAPPPSAQPGRVRKGTKRLNRKGARASARAGAKP